MADEKPEGAACPLFGRCGGCTSQGIPYKDQLLAKKRRLAVSARVKEENVLVFSGKEYGYRSRMDFIFCKGGLGLREKDNWKRAVPVKYCPIADEKTNQLLGEVRSFFKEADVFDLVKKTGTFRYAVIRTSSKDSAVSLVINSKSNVTHSAIEEVKRFCKETSAEDIIVTYVPPETDMSVSSEYSVVKGKDCLEEEYLGKTFEYSVQGFFQNNHEMAREMQKYVQSLLKKSLEAGKGQGNTHLLDLYGGVGTFGIINFDLFSRVTIVESFKECIDSAKKNIEKNKSSNVETILLDAQKIKELSLPDEEELYVVTDPPRSGMHPDTIRDLNNRKPRVIIYISCNIRQLSKELPLFQGYETRSVAMFDLFPQTQHYEGVVELVRKQV
ncbi:class I SAM-dependent RNA methyltransferase [Candidatus Woesearchaeota archaeon]|nr:class I SAM-dependent RNA methyltransferase [Candidatus Woesearchaeota archaeon]